MIHDSEVYTPCAGDVYILHKGHRHDYFSSADDPWVKKFFNIRGDLCVELLRMYSLENTVLVKNCDVKNLFDEMYELSKSMTDQPELLDCLAVKLHELIIAISHYACGKPDNMSEVKRFIDSNLHRIVANRELSELIFRSEDFVIKEFRRRYGQTPYDYQIERKMEIARKLLSETVMTVGDISACLGYSDSHYFSNIFKLKCGISPMKYRQNKN